MAKDDNQVTFENVELTVGGWIFIPDPPGSFPVDPIDARLSLEGLLVEAMMRCGLKDRVEDVLHEVRNLAAPHFAKEVERLEGVRQKYTQ